MTISKKNWKYSFFFFLFLTVYYSFVWLVLPFFTDPQVHKFEKYNRLWNWDLRHHARGDFDNDGQDDLISFTGCAFLSSVNTAEIPKSQQCTASGVAGMVFRGEENKVGQKYIQFDEIDLSLGAFNQGLPISHSYLGKEKNRNWKIFVNSNGNLSVYEIENNGILRNTNEIDLANKIDEFLYSVSRFFILLALPLIPLSFVFGFLFGPFRSVNNMVPLHEVVTLSLITIVLLLIWQSSNKTKS